MIRHYDNTSMLDLNLYQFQIQHGVLTQDYVMHTHDFYEIVVILGGSGEHVIGEQRYLLRRGDVFVIRGDLPHGFQRVERLELINLLYNQSIFDRQAEELRLFPGFEELFLLEPELRYESAFQDMLNLCEDDLEDLLHMADFLSRQLNAQEKGFETIVRMTFLTLIAFLSTKYTAMSVGSREMRMVACALRYMQEHLAENIRAEHIAQNAALSVRHLDRLFRRYYGQSPMACLAELRLRSALMLLQKGSDSIAAVAEKSGFGDASYFARSFKKRYGRTPRQYRAQWLNGRPDGGENRSYSPPGSAL